MTYSIPVTLIFGEEKAIPSSAHPRLVRWSLFLSGYNYQIIYPKKVQVPDCLSRLASDDTTGDADISQLHVLNIREDAPQISEIQEEVQKNPVLKQISHWTLHGWPASLPKACQSVICKQYFMNIPEINAYNNFVSGSKINSTSQIKTNITTNDT